MKNILIVWVDTLLLILGAFLLMSLSVDNNNIVTVKVAMYIGFVAGVITTLVIKNLFSTAKQVWRKKRT